VGPTSSLSRTPDRRRRFCEPCGINFDDLVVHEEETHINEATVKVLTGENLTLHRTKGYFRCPWCCYKTVMRSAFEMQVGPGVSSPAGL
jgi:hypothetical protein